MQIQGFEFYGSTTVGAKGQVVLPAKLRQELKITAGDKLVVLSHHAMPAHPVLMVKSRDLTELFQKIFGKDLGKLVTKQRKRNRGTDEK